MRILLSILRNYFYVILFIILEVLSIYILVKNNRYQNSHFYNISTEVSGNIAAANQNIRELFALRQSNKELQEENSYLRAKLIESHIKNILNTDTTYTDSIHYVDSTYKPFYTYIPTNITYSTTGLNNNLFIVNAGKKHGIEIGMSVISPNGIVGIINKVSTNFSSIISVLHSESKVSIKLAKSSYTGSLIWAKTDYKHGVIIDIPSHVKINIGEPIVTSGFSLSFPENILVGHIKTVLPSDNSDFHKIQIEFSQDYRNLDKVYIVKNLQIEELKTLMVK